MPKIDKDRAPVGSGSRYPPPYNAPCLPRHWLKLGDAAGLTQFGVHELTLEPGSWSSQRHWHATEDEFVYVLAGEVVLVTNAGEVALGPGDCAGFAAGDPDGHCLQNRTAGPVRLLVVGGRRDDDVATYPDIDLAIEADRYRGPARFTRKDGTPY